MSKTIDLQIAKSRKLIDSLRKNPSVMAHLGISDDELTAMNIDLEALVKVGSECDALRIQTTAKVKETNAMLAKVKENFAANKRLVKENYPQEQWLRYGVEDKR